MPKRLDIRLDDDLYGELVKHAEAQDRSVNWIVGQAVRGYCVQATQPGLDSHEHSPRAMSVDVPAGEVHVGGKGAGTQTGDPRTGPAERGSAEDSSPSAPRAHVNPSFKGGKR